MRPPLTLALAAAFLLPTGAHAADFPGNKPVTMVVPFTAGGPSDRVARDLADALRKTLGTNVVVENTAGAGSSIGTAKVARAQPDGYTLLLNHISMATMPGLYRKLPFDIERDFAFLGIVNDVPMTLIGKPTLPATDFKGLTAWIAANKGAINLGNAGVGSASHLCGLLFQSALKTEMTAIAYKGAAPAIVDLMGNQIDLLCDQTTNTSQQIEGNKVRAYGVTTAQRLATPALKNLPTLQEAGLKGFEVTTWHGLYAPKGTPAAVVERINGALRQALKDPAFVQRQEGLGAVVADGARTTPDGHRAFVSAEIAKWTPIIRAAGIYAD